MKGSIYVYMYTPYHAGHQDTQSAFSSKPLIFSHTTMPPQLEEL